MLPTAFIIYSLFFHPLLFSFSPLPHLSAALSPPPLTFLSLHLPLYPFPSPPPLFPFFLPTATIATIVTATITTIVTTTTTNYCYQLLLTTIATTTANHNY